MLRTLSIFGLALLLCSCSERSDGRGRLESTPGQPPSSAPAAGLAKTDAKIAADEVASSGPRAPLVAPPADGGPAMPSDARQIAYTYTRTLEVPSERMQDLLNAHKSACEKAGSSICYISSSTLRGLGTENSSGVLELHAAPGWMKTFLEGLPESLRAYGATVDASNTASEDLTVQIVDTSARLNSAKMLRERLSGLLKDRPGKLSDLLDIERELARVQADIDATESVIAALKARVGMSALTLTYEAKLNAVSRSIWRPLGEAFGAFLPNLVESLAAVVNLVSGAILWIALAAGLIWAGLAALARRRRRRTTAMGGPLPSPPPAPKGPRPV